MRSLPAQASGVLALKRFATLATAGGLALGLGSGCSTPTPSFEDVADADVLYAEGLQTLEGRRFFLLFHTVDYQAAIDSFQAVIDNYPYRQYAVLAELKIADGYFEDGKYEEALSYYRDFADLHPQHEKLPYTLYQSALSYYRQTRSPDRDQQPTREALTYLERVMARYPRSKEAERAEELWRELRLRLARNEMRIANFYMKRGEHESAAGRYQQVLDDYPGLGLDAEVLYQLGVCYLRTDKEEKARRAFQAIIENYADSEAAPAAANLIVTVE